MNTELLKSKKFRAALMTAIGSLLAFLVTKLGLNWDIDEILTLISTIMVPFLMYIHAEGFSEMQAKKVVEENKARKEITQDVLQNILNKGNESNENKS